MNIITDIGQLDLKRSYTYSDYLTWRFIDRVELIWGKVKKMTPAPSARHQKVLGDLFVAVKIVLKGNPCQVFIAPFDVRLPLGLTEIDNPENVVQPDLCVICDETKIDEKGCKGAPDLIVEVLSPASSTRDLKDKRDLYEKAGVREYWVVDPFDGIVHLLVLGDAGKFQMKYPATALDEIRSSTIPGLVIDMKDVFPDILRESEETYGLDVD